MDRKHLTVKYGSLIHLSCDDGYVTAAGVGDESLFIRSNSVSAIDGEELPFLGFETSVFQLVAPDDVPNGAKNTTNTSSDDGRNVGDKSNATATTSETTKNSSGNNNINASKSNDSGANPNGVLFLDHFSKINTQPEVTFGQTFLLVHVVSQLQVAVLPSKPSENDPDCVKIVLARPSDVSANYREFSFASRYKIHDEGDSVCRGDEVLIRLAAFPTFVHVSAPSSTLSDSSHDAASPVDCGSNDKKRGTDECPSRRPLSTFHGESVDPAAPTLAVPVAAALAAQEEENAYLSSGRTLEVNASEERGVVFVVERYDLGRDRANYQRALQRIPRPYVPAGVPVALFHRERECLLTTSLTKPRSAAESNLFNDEDNPVTLLTRSQHSATEGIQATRGAVRSDGMAELASAMATMQFAQADGMVFPIVVPDGPAMRRGVAGDTGAVASETLEDAPWGCTALWILENEDPKLGGPVFLTSQRYRLRQACTNRYLAVAGSGVDAFFEDADGSLAASMVEAAEVASVAATSLTGRGVVRATTLCMIPPPRTQRDLQRTLFTVSPMFVTECGFLIENDCLFLQNVLTQLYVCTRENDNQLCLQWQTPLRDTIVAQQVTPTSQKNVLFLWGQCEQLCKYRNAFQALAASLKSSEKPLNMGKNTKFIPEEDNDVAESMSARARNQSALSRGGGSSERKIGQVEGVANTYISLLPLIRVCQKTLTELIRFCSASPEKNVFRRDGIPITENQRMLFDLHVHRLVFEVIVAPFARLITESEGIIGGITGTPGQLWGTVLNLPQQPLRGGVIDLDDVVQPIHAEVHAVCRLAFRLLRQMIRKAQTLKVGFDEFIPYFLELDGHRFRVTETLVEIFSDNAEITLAAVEHITEHVIAGIRRSPSAGYVQLLASMCAVGFRGVASRQEFICQRFLIDHPDVFPHFVATAAGEWAIVTTNGETTPAATVFVDPNDKNTRFIVSVVDLFARLCFDGCPAMCRVEVARAFPPDALLIALRTFLWTGEQVVGKSNPWDELRGHILRVAIQCYIMPRISDPTAQLRANTVLFGSSQLRVQYKTYNKNANQNTISTFSGIPDDDLTRAVKVATVQIIRANPHFVQSDMGRSGLLRASLNAWLRLVNCHQYTDVETHELLPLLLGLLDGKRDELGEKVNKIAALTRSRLEVSEASVQVTRAREMICRTLLSLLNNAIHRGADEIILFLHRAFVGGGYTPFRPRQDRESAHAAAMRVRDKETGEVLLIEPISARHLRSERRGDEAKGHHDMDHMADDSEDDGDGDSNGNGSRKRKMMLRKKKQHPHESESLLPSLKNCFGIARRRHRAGYQSIDGDDHDEEMQHGRDPDCLLDPRDVVEYLRRVCGSIIQLFRVHDLVPRLMDLTRYDSPRLTTQAMELLISLCAVRRAVAHRVLQVHTFPSVEVVRGFDTLYEVAARLQTLIGVRGDAGTAADIAAATALALSSFEEQTKAGEGRKKEEKGAADSDNEEGDHNAEEYEEEEEAEETEEAEEGSGDDTDPTHAKKGEGDTSKKSQRRALWAKTAAAARIMSYRRSVRQRRRALGLSASSRTPLRLVVRAEMVCHWRIHIPLLLIADRLDPLSEAFTHWMRFFYLFALSQGCARVLHPFLDVFISRLNANPSCTVTCLHIIIAILGTTADPTPRLTTELLTACADRIDTEARAPYPDDEFVRILGANIFSKPVVTGAVRRRMLRLLRERDTLRVLSQPRVQFLSGEVAFTRALTQLLCNICGTAMSAVAMGQRALPSMDIFALITEYGTRCSPLRRRRMSAAERRGFRLVGTYLSALVSLYIAAGEEGDAAERRMEWMECTEWWDIVQLLSDLLRGVTELIKDDTGRVVNRGLRVVQRYRQLLLVTIPVALVTFMTERFDLRGYYRCRDKVGTIMTDMCSNVLQFSAVLLTHASALDLQLREAVNYRRLMHVLLQETKNLIGHERESMELEAGRNQLRTWLLRRDAEERERRRVNAIKAGNGLSQRDNSHNEKDDEQFGVGDVFLSGEGVSRRLQENPGPGLYLPSATAKCRDVDIVRSALRTFVRRDVLISLEDSMDPNEAAGVLNSQLRRSPELTSVREFVSSVLNGMRRRSFSPMAFVGLLNCMHNALRDALAADENDDDTEGGSNSSSSSGGGVGGGGNGEAGEALQLIFSDLGVAQVVASVFSIDNEVMTFSAAQLGVALLDGGNARVQWDLLYYFETHQEGFFHSVRDVLLKAQEWSCRINTEQQLAILERGGILVSGVSNVQRFTSILLANACSSTSSSPSSTPVTSSSSSGALLRPHRAVGWDSVQGSMRVEMICALFRLLQLFCEGHNLSMQNYIRSQHDNMHSANVVYEVMCLISTVSITIHPATVDLVVRGFELLTELCQGPCHLNQQALLSYDVCNTIRHVLHLLNRLDATGNVGIPQENRGDSNSTGNRSTTNDDGKTIRVQRSLTKTEMGCLRIALSTNLLSLIEGCRTPAVFQRIFFQIPVEYIEYELATTPPQMYDCILEDEDLEDDPTIQSTFNWLIFLNTVRPFAEGLYLQHIDEMLRRSAKLGTRLGCIEVRRDDGLLEKVFFRIPLICRGLTQTIKDGVLWGVNRTSRATKLSDFMHRSDNLIFEVEQAHAFQRWVVRWTRFNISNHGGSGEEDKSGSSGTEKDNGNTKEESRFQRGILAAKMAWNRFLAPVFFSYQMSFYEYASVFVATLVNIILVFLEGTAWNPEVAFFGRSFVAYLCVTQFTLSCIALGMETVVFFPVCLYTEYRQKQLLAGRTKLNATMQEVFNGLMTKEIVRLFCTRFTVLFRAFLVIMSALSVSVSSYFAAAHLLLVIYKTPTLRTFISAITQNGKQLSLSALLGVVVLYLFAIVGYLGFPSAFGGEEKDSNENCGTLLRCFTFMLWQGLRQGGGVGDVMEEEAWTSPTLIPRLSYDLFFFALVNVIFLNIMFGIIIDTFGELRDDKREKESDMYSTCFICGLDSDTLESGHVGGFRTHVREEHNMWMYLYFMHYLRRKDPNDFTGQESYVSAKIQRGDLSFFPEEECLSLAEASDPREDAVEEGDESAAPKSGGPDGGRLSPSAVSMAAALKELAGVKEALGVCVREMGADAQKVKALLQQLELAHRGAAGGSNTGGGSLRGGANTHRPGSVLETQSSGGSGGARRGT